MIANPENLKLLCLQSIMIKQLAVNLILVGDPFTQVPK